MVDSSETVSSPSRRLICGV